MDLIWNGKRLLVPGGNLHIAVTPSAPTPTELFSFRTTGTTVSELNAYGGAPLTQSDYPTWNFGDTTTGNTINTQFSKTYTSGYISPADKRVSFSLLPDSHSKLYYLSVGPSSGPKEGLYSLDVSQVSMLTTLYANYTSLTTLNLSNNLLLSNLSVNGSDVSTIDLTNNTAISTISANNTKVKTITFNTSTTYPNVGAIYLNNNNMNSTEVNNLIDYFYTNINIFPSSSKYMDLGGNNAKLTIPSVHKLMALESYSGFTTFGANYNVSDNVMVYYFNSAGNPSNISSYTYWLAGNSPSLSNIYGNSITGITNGNLNMDWYIYANTNLSNFQGSNVTWTFKVKVKKHWSDGSFITVDNTVYTFTGNTSGSQLMKHVSTGFTGMNNVNAAMEFEITLTDNRANKNQVGGDSMVLTIATTLTDDGNPNGSIIVSDDHYNYGNYKTTTNDFIRTKWGA